MIYFIFNTVTGKATSSARTRDAIVRAYNAGWARKRGPDQVIVQLPDELGVDVDTMPKLDRAVIWKGVADFAAAA
jgi:hypothetical protein